VYVQTCLVIVFNHVNFILFYFIFFLKLNWYLFFCLYILKCHLQLRSLLYPLDFSFRQVSTCARPRLSCSLFLSGVITSIKLLTTMVLLSHLSLDLVPRYWYKADRSAHGHIAPHRSSRFKSSSALRAVLSMPTSNYGMVPTIPHARCVYTLRMANFAPSVPWLRPHEAPTRSPFATLARLSFPLLPMLSPIILTPHLAIVFPRLRPFKVVHSARTHSIRPLTVYKFYLRPMAGRSTHVSSLYRDLTTTSRSLSSTPRMVATGPSSVSLRHLGLVMSSASSTPLLLSSP